MVVATKTSRRLKPSDPGDRAGGAGPWQGFWVNVARIMALFDVAPEGDLAGYGFNLKEVPASGGLDQL